MELKKDADGGPAFPGGVIMIPIKDTADQAEVNRAGRMIASGLPEGASILDLFAMAALGGLLACSYSVPGDIAETSYRYAEAMLAERERRDSDGLS